MTVTLLITGCVAFWAGYITARVTALLSELRSQQPGACQGGACRGFSVKNSTSQPRAAISIDERTVVTDIKTDTLAKTQDIQLGKQSVQADNLEASVRKLAQLKRS